MSDHCFVWSSLDSNTSVTTFFELAWWPSSGLFLSWKQRYVYETDMGFWDSFYLAFECSSRPAEPNIFDCRSLRILHQIQCSSCIRIQAHLISQSNWASITLFRFLMCGVSFVCEQSPNPAGLPWAQRRRRYLPQIISNTMTLACIKPTGIAELGSYSYYQPH